MADVVVVGAGFAGLAATRELARAGVDVVLLEARDRIGGRTWTDVWEGVDVEMGGGWVHWCQPHTWSELTRAGLGLTESIDAERLAWRADGELRSGARDDVHPRIFGAAWDRFMAPVRDALPRPHDVRHAWDLAAAYDGISILDRIDALGLDADARAILHAEMIGLVHGPAEDASAIEAMRWHALGGYTLEGTEESGGAFGIEGGMKALAEAVHAGSGVPVRFGVEVVRVRRAGDGAVVETAAGEEVEARAVVLALPLNALRGVAIEPAPPAAIAEWIARGQASQGMKLWIRAGGDVPPTLALDPGNPLSFVMPDRVLPSGEQLLVTFSERSSAVRPDDLDWVQAQLDLLAPGYEVRATTTHDWTADPYARGTWSVHRPGWHATGVDAFRAGLGPIRFAGSDFARGWAGFVDGALESGTRAGLDLVRELG